MRTFVRLVIGALVAGAGARGARADVGGEVAIGGGVHAGDAMTAIDARADWADAGGGAAIGLGVRVRAVGDELVRGDWDGAADWAAIVRYAELRRGDVEVAAGAQPVVTMADGALIDGVVPAAILDRRATGVHARVRVGGGAATIEALVDDVTRPTVIGARGATEHVAVELAGDPFAGFGAIAASGALAHREHDVTDRVELGVRGETSRALGAWIAATTAADLGGARFALRVEATAGTARDTAAPFGPLYMIERDLMRAPDADAGLGGAARLDVDALAVHVSGEMRARPGLGGEYEARIAAPAYDDVQVAVLVAGNPSRDLLVAGGAIRARLGARAFVGAEAARQLDESTARAAWQATAWLGFATAP